MRIMLRNGLVVTLCSTFAMTGLGVYTESKPFLVLAGVFASATIFLCLYTLIYFYLNVWKKDE